jgi:hypothetical protein
MRPYSLLEKVTGGYRKSEVMPRSTEAVEFQTEPSNVYILRATR